MLGEIDLLNVLKNRDNYGKYAKRIKSHAVTKETKKIIDGLGEYFDKYSDDEVDWSDFSLFWHYVYYPSKNPDIVSMYDKIFDKLEKTKTPSGPVKDVIERFLLLDHLGKVIDTADKIVNGDKSYDMDDIVEIVDKYYADSSRPLEDDGKVTTSLSELTREVVRSGGLEWRLEDLNRSVGPIRQGDLIIVGARPEIGKTSFVCSEATYMAEQIGNNKKVIIFNNEERGEKIALRLYQAALGWSLSDILADESKTEMEYAVKLGCEDKIVVYDKPSFHVREIDRILAKEQPSLVIFNILPKIKGFDKTSNNDVDRLQNLFQWARENAKSYCPIIGLMQAGGDAEGKKYLNQSHLYGSKTNVQGEADVIVGIGASHDPTEANIRFISVMKNKLPGGPRTEETLKHMKHEVKFNATTSRFETIVWR